MKETWAIGNVPIHGKAILAPMAGVSDIAYRYSQRTWRIHGLYRDG